MLPKRFPGASGGTTLRLTKANISKLGISAGKSDAIFFDDDMPGFGLRVRQGGKRTWIAQYRLASKTRRMTLGTVETLTPERARAEAAKILSTVTLGGDPQADKVAAREKVVVTFGAVVPLYLSAVKGRQRPGYHAEVSRYLKVHWSPLSALPMESINRAMVAKRLGELSASNGRHSADRARANLSGCFSWLIAEGLADANPVIGTNRPADPVARERTLDDDELRLVWHSLAPGDYGAIVRLLILTGCRREEVAGMARSERKGDLWTIPSERSKNGRPLELPLPAMAAAILDGVPTHDDRDRVFGGGEGSFSGWSKSKARLDARMLATLRQADPKATLRPWRLHDIRRTVATEMGEIGVQPHIVEAVLNHQSGAKAGIAGRYNKAVYRAEKRAALDLWASHVEALVRGK